MVFLCFYACAFCLLHFAEFNAYILGLQLIWAHELKFLIVIEHTERKSIFLSPYLPFFMPLPFHIKFLISWLERLGTVVFCKIVTTV